MVPISDFLRFASMCFIHLEFKFASDPGTVLINLACIPLYPCTTSVVTCVAVIDIVDTTKRLPCQLHLIGGNLLLNLFTPRVSYGDIKVILSL